MKQYLLFIFLFSLVCNVGFGQNCFDLSTQKQDLEKVITQIDDKISDKTKLKQLSVLFKSCVTPEELKNIRNTYLSLTFDAPQQQSYKSIIKKVLDENKLLCVNFVNNTQQGTNKNYVADLDALFVEYEGLKQKHLKTNNYNGTPTENNYNVLSQLKSLLSDCVVGENLKRVQELNNQIITEGFNGGKTKEFNANLRELLGLNSELFETSITTPTVKDTSETSEEEIIEENVKSEDSKSNFWMYLFYLFFGMSVSVNAYFLYEKFIKKTKEDEPKTTVNTKPKTNLTAFEKEELKGLKKTNDNLTKENKNLQTQLNTANDKIKNLEAVQKKSEEVADRTTSTVINQFNHKSSKQEKQKKTYTEVQYFASPNEQGEFIAKNGQNEIKSGASIYRFEIKGADAEIEFFNHISTFQNTLNNPNRLNAVCNFVNDYNPDATKIKTEKKGKAILQGDKWKVIKKAEIRYEA